VKIEVDLEGEVGGWMAGVGVDDRGGEWSTEWDLGNGNMDSTEVFVSDDWAVMGDHETKLGNAKPINIEAHLPERTGCAGMMKDG
jgi:hypothetical protein